jgi:hypothetical protein
MNLRPCLLVLLAVASCAAPTPPQPHEFIDETTANTLLVAGAPLVFARERSDVAAHARDYLTLVGLEIDISGKYQQFLLAYRWSTVDPRMAAPPPLTAGALTLIADGRAINLRPLDRLPVGLAPRELLLVPNHGDVIARGYAVDAQTLRYLSGSRTLLARLPQEPLDLPFTLWEDGRGALGAFLARASSQ